MMSEIKQGIIYISNESKREASISKSEESIPISTKFHINPNISNDKHILNNMEAYMVNNTLPKDYCIKQYGRILKFYNTNEVLNQFNYASVLLDFKKQN